MQRIVHYVRCVCVYDVGGIRTVVVTFSFAMPLEFGKIGTTSAASDVYDVLSPLCFHTFNF